MAGDSLAEELVQVLRGINATLTVKLSHLLAFVFRNRNASSLGAAAGLAIAIALCWTWRCWPRGNKEPHTAPTPTMDDPPATATSTAVAASITHATQRGKPPTPEADLSLPHVVRRQLNGGRRMTLQLLGVVLEERTPDELRAHAVVRREVVEVLLEIARACDLYLLARVVDDASEAVVMAALGEVGMWAVMNREKVLFCSTEAGRTSFVRQLEPDWHVDTVREVNAGLAPFVRQQLHVGSAAPIAQNVYVVESLDQYFSGAFCS